MEGRSNNSTAPHAHTFQGSKYPNNVLETITGCRGEMWPALGCHGRSCSGGSSPPTLLNPYGTKAHMRRKKISGVPVMTTCTSLPTWPQPGLGVSFLSDLTAPGQGACCSHTSAHAAVEALDLHSIRPCQARHPFTVNMEKDLKASTLCLPGLPRDAQNPRLPDPPPPVKDEEDKRIQ